MNRLKLMTRSLGSSQYSVLWRTGAAHCGVLNVTIAHAVQDEPIAAELLAAQYLLEQKNVCGHDKTGAGLEITFSFGAIKKLMRAESAKAHLSPYATFLRTRFLGAKLNIDPRRSDNGDGQIRESISFASYIPEELQAAGIGSIELTSHAVEQFIERFNRKETRAWRDLRDWLSENKSVPYVHNRRSALANIKHRRLGQFYLLPDRELVLVVTPASSMQINPKLVTVYRQDI